MVKRGSENSQQSKSDFLEELAASSRPGPTSSAGTFQRASTSQLERRKVVRAVRPVAPPPSASGAVNPFAGVNLLGAGTTTTAGQNTRDLPNPPPPAAATAAAPARSKAELHRISVEQLNSLEMVVNSMPSTANLDSVLQQYLYKSYALDAEYRRAYGGAPAIPLVAVPHNDDAIAIAAPPPAAAVAVAASNPAPASIFQFGGAAPTAAAPSGSFGLFAPAPAAPAPAAFAAASNNNNNNNDDEAGATLDDGDTTIGKTEDKGWDNIATYRVNFYRREDAKDKKSKYVSFVVGDLHLQRDQTDAWVCRLLMRDPSGTRVRVNMALPKNTKFTKSESVNSKTKKAVTQISFAGINDTARGMEPFIIKVAGHDKGSELHDKLKDMVR